jgi:hypothetical protein
MKIAVVEKFLWSWRRGRVWLGCRLKISFLEKRQAGKTIFRPQPPFKAAAPPLLFGIRHCFDKLSLCFRSLRSRLSLLWLPPPFHARPTVTREEWHDVEFQQSSARNAQPSMAMQFVLDYGLDGLDVEGLSLRAE